MAAHSFPFPQGTFIITGLMGIAFMIFSGIKL